MTRKPRSRARRRGAKKQMKYTRVISKTIVTVDNLEEFAEKLGQDLTAMEYALAQAEMMNVDIEVTEYHDRYELNPLKRDTPFNREYIREPGKDEL